MNNFREVGVKIEFKWFSVNWANRGGSVRWTERTRNATYLLDLDRSDARWISLKIRNFISNPLSCSDFYRLRGCNATIVVHRFVSKRGRFLEISKFSNQGKKQNIIIPSGFKLQGWIRISDILINLLSGRQVRVGNKIVNSRNQINFKAGDRAVIQDSCKVIEATYCKSSETNWKAAIIITRGRVNVSWDSVARVLGCDVQRRIDIHPFQANQALWWPENQKEWEHYTQLKRGFFDGGVALDFESWCPESFAKDSVLSCCNSWIKIAGLPWHLWTFDILKEIGHQCGGLMEISKDTSLLRSLAAARIKVKGKRNGFISNRILLKNNGFNLDLTISVDTFDQKAYELYGKQTYAQALINGKRTVEGGECTNIRRHMPEFEDQIQSTPDSSAEEEVLRNATSAEVKHKVYSEQSANRKDRKVDKILQRISPKTIEDFVSSPIHSLSNGDVEKKDLSVPVEEQIPPIIPEGGKNLSLPIISTSMANKEVMAEEIPFVNKWKDSTNISESELDDTDDFDEQQPEDDQWEEGFASSESGSIFSSQSEIQPCHEATNWDLKKLFMKQDEAQNSDIQPTTQGITDPLGGKVLSCFPYSNSKLPFSLHSFFPASFIVWVSLVGS
ncbi:uncharacterized protein [Primulina eburnea]|uniref:uncharacterized protein n=1 Tax=Primulina eburnea TaxID=1245227 RepID=UPI003C6CC480